MSIELLTKEEIKKAGFFYEPDISTCHSVKLRLYVPKDELVNDEFKKNIIEEIPFVYVHQVTKTPNPYEGDPNFLADPKVLVVGHNRGTELTRKWVKTGMLDGLHPNWVVDGAEFINEVTKELLSSNPKEGTPEYDRLDKLAGIVLPVAMDLFRKFYTKLPAPKWIVEECSKFFDEKRELYEDLVKHSIALDTEIEFARYCYDILERKYDELHLS